MPNLRKKRTMGWDNQHPFSYDSTLHNWPFIIYAMSIDQNGQYPCIFLLIQVIVMNAMISITYAGHSKYKCKQSGPDVFCVLINSELEYDIHLWGRWGSKHWKILVLRKMKIKSYVGTHSHQMLLLPAPHICCTSFLELPHVAELESREYTVANSRLWLKKVFPNSCGSSKRLKTKSIMINCNVHKIC